MLKVKPVQVTSYDLLGNPILKDVPTPVSAYRYSPPVEVLSPNTLGRRSLSGYSSKGFILCNVRESRVTLLLGLDSIETPVSTVPSNLQFRL